MDFLAIKKAWEIVRRPDVCAPPYYVQLEVTTHCNMACYMCVRNEAIKHPQHLAFQDYLRIFDQTRPRKLTLSGAGEPLLCPDLVRMIVHARGHGTSMMIPSNGTLLSRPEVAQGIVEAKLNVIKISIDAATPQTYQAIRRQDCFDRIIEGIERVNELKSRRASRWPEMRFDVVILKENCTELAEIVKLAARLKVGTVFFRALQATGIGGRREEVIGKDVDFDGLYRTVRQGICEARRLGIRTNLKDVARDFQAYRSLYVKQDAAMSNQVCLLPWLQCFISVRGELSPCCATYTNAGFSAGNVLKEGFEAAWNGEKMQALRRQFRTRQDPFAVCRDCIPRSLPVLLKMSSMLPGFVFARRESSAGTHPG